MKRGIDVSEHNGVIDWETVKNSGVEFAMIRAGYGQGTIDQQFVRNITECNRIGLPVGVYWFSYATDVSAAKREAIFCLDAIKPYKVEYPISFDFEYDSVRYAKKEGITISKVLSSEMAKAFCGSVESAGYHTLNYANRDYLTNYFDSTVTHDVWLAEWPVSVDLTKVKPGCVMWQYSSKGKVPGISGNVDMDVCYKDYEEAEMTKEEFKSMWLEMRKELQDNDSNAYSADAREWAVSSGLIQGGDSGEFNGMWEDFMTREQLVTVLYRFAQKFNMV